jgi:hypothetical protein
MTALGAIELGNTVLGRFAFDPDVADRDPAPGSGDWTAFGQHDPGPMALEVLAYSIIDLAYRGTTIPAREAIDDGQTGDRLHFSGCEGPGTLLRFCFLAELADAGGNALEGPAWPTEIDLMQWGRSTRSRSSRLRGWSEPIPTSSAPDSRSAPRSRIGTASCGQFPSREPSGFSGWVWRWQPDVVGSPRSSSRHRVAFSCGF